MAITLSGSGKGDYADQAEDGSLVIDKRAAAIAAGVRQLKQPSAVFQSGEQPTCVGCGDPISPRRLEALPGTRRCRDCEEIRQKYGS